MTSLEPADLTVVVSGIGTGDVGVTLASLGRQTVSGFATIVLVHAAAPPDKLGDGVTLVQVDTPELMHAHDSAIEKASTSLVLMLSAGLEATPGLIAAHLAAHNETPEDNRGARGAVEWHPAVPDTPLNRWLARDRVDEIETNFSFKRTLFLDATAGDDGIGGEASVVVRLRRAGVTLHDATRARALDVRAPGWGDVLSHYQNVARTEVQLAAIDPTFDAPIRKKTLAVAGRGPISPMWPRLSNRVPRSLGRLTDARTDDWFRQQVADAFLDSWEGQRDFAELREYLGDRYDHASLVQHTAAVEDEEHALDDEDAFYRTSEAYLYDLTVFAMSGTKAPYRRVIRSLVPTGARVLDYGCGLGSDGLRLLDQGYDVEFADFDNPSTRFLKWRLAHRGLSAPIHDVDVDVPGGFDLAFCFDVIEHIEEPVAFLEELETKAGIVVINFLEPTPDDVHIHHFLDVPALVDAGEETRVALVPEIPRPVASRCVPNR